MPVSFERDGSSRQQLSLLLLGLVAALLPGGDFAKEGCFFSLFFSLTASVPAP